MNTGETSDQIVRMTLQGIEVAANGALKAGGEMTRSLAATLYAILTDKKKVKGKARLDSLLKSGKELKVFAIRHEDLKKFCEEAKRYGVLYSVLKEKNNTDGICDIMVRAEDASKISRIVDKFELATIDTKAIRESIMNAKENPLQDVPTLTDKEHDELVNALMNSTVQERKVETPQNENPTLARNKTSDNLFEPTSEKVYVAEDTTKEVRPSVRKELKDIKEKQQKEMKKNKQQSQSKYPQKKTKHKRKKKER